MPVKITTFATIDADRLAKTMQLPGLEKAEIWVALEIWWKGTKFQVQTIDDAVAVLTKLVADSGEQQPGEP